MNKTSICSPGFDDMVLGLVTWLCSVPEGDLMMYCDVKSESSPEREPVDDDAKGAEDTDGNKKRKRKPYRPGRFKVQNIFRFGELETYMYFGSKIAQQKLSGKTNPFI